MSAQPQHPGLRSVPSTAVGDVGGLVASCLLSCTTESLQCATGEIIVLRVVGEVDRYTVPILQAALEDSLDQHPAHLVLDLARMSFCSMRGLALLTQTDLIAAEDATGYALSGVLPHIDRVWALCCGDDRPVRYHSTAAAVTAIRAAESDAQHDRGRRWVPGLLRPPVPAGGGNLRYLVTHHRSRPNFHPNERIEDVPT